MILDTTVLVDLLRNDPATKRRILELEQSGEPLWIPTPAIFELAEGAERSDRTSEERKKIAEVLSGYTVLPLAAPSALRAGEVSGLLIRRGEMIDPIDAQIAGIALEENQPVLTKNTRHFGRVPNLDIEDY
ncbi:MAG: PIN domain-containing protein [Thermoplasmatota archaeon]